jgi:hypothetical protein
MTTTSLVAEASRADCILNACSIYWICDGNAHETAAGKFNLYDVWGRLDLPLRSGRLTEPIVLIFATLLSRPIMILSS